MRTRALFFAAVAVLAALTRATAQTYSLEPVADARILNFPGDAVQNYASDILSVYTSTSGGNTQRTFIQFNLSSITLTTNDQITSATLTLISSTSFGTNSFRPMEVYRVLSPWTESGLTWLNRDATHAWTNDGGDFIGTGGQPYAVSTNSPTNGQPVSWDVTKLAQEWLTNAANNYGLLLKSSDSNQLTFAQRESATPAVRPKLTVVVGLPPIRISPSPGQALLSWTGAGVLQERTNLNAGLAWADSTRTITHLNGTNSVTITGLKTNSFFRLRGP